MSLPSINKMFAKSRGWRGIDFESSGPAVIWLDICGRRSCCTAHYGSALSMPSRPAERLDQHSNLVFLYTMPAMPKHPGGPGLSRSDDYRQVQRASSTSHAPPLLRSRLRRRHSTRREVIQFRHPQESCRSVKRGR